MCRLPRIFLKCTSFSTQRPSSLQVKIMNKMFPVSKRGFQIASTSASGKKIGGNSSGGLTEVSHEYELISPIKESFFGQVITHMRHNFFADEPTSQMLGIGRNNEPVPMYEDLFVEALKEGLSIMYLHTATNQIAALSINGISRPSDINGGRKSAVSNTEVPHNVLTIYNLSTEIHRCLNLFDKYGVDKIFDIKVVSVDKNHRNKGLAKALISVSLDLAECIGIKVVKTEGTSAYSQKAFRNAGFKTVWERNYTAFVRENGDPVFMPVDPHVSIMIMTKILSE